jgi:hypothetical protein
MNHLILSTGDFPCPDSGWGCRIYWNVNEGVMWAEISKDAGIWKDFEGQDQSVKDDTYYWCNSFGRPQARSVAEANRVLDKWLEEEALYYYFDEDEL